ncbi:substrate-binding domain-containing protein [Erwinia sp. P7711]|uniref:LacI family DNA-binding transcriptional regulator n=1 Tax=Erwinia sp. P7711 TaxID=3141451 RepID=UPI00318E8566
MMQEKTVVSAQDVALRAGVSRSAVSRVFTPGASVSEPMRARVLKAAEELGYHVNHLARSLVRNRSGIVCLIVSEVATPYRATLVSWLTQLLQEAGKVAMIINTDRSDSRVSAALQQAINFRADASIILSGMPDRTITRLCYQHGQHLVLINRDETLPGSLSINLDSTQAAETALMAFQRAGCRHLAFANSLAGTPSLIKREADFLAAAARAGIAVTVERFGSTSYESGQILAHRLLTRQQRPDAIYCVTDLVACGVMDEARHRFGLRIPEDLCVVGYDNIPQSGWSSYNLTTFTQPIEQFAREAVRWLIEQDNHSDELRPRTGQLNHSLIYEANVVWRGSVRSG